MLIELHVHDYILIDRLELHLGPGFNVLTGETGAGKSIVIGALGLVLGGRARGDMVRPGAKEACVEALFDLSASPALTERLEAMGVPVEGELVIRRVVQKAGRSRAYLNGRLCTVAELTSLAGDLADVTSQHESVALTDSSRHLGYLDRYACLEDKRDVVANLYDELVAARRAIAEMRAREQEGHEREAFLRYQLKGIEEVEPQPGELEELSQERNRLRHATKLSEVTRGVASGLDDEGGLCDRLGRLVSDLRGAAELDGALEPLAGELDDIWSRLREESRVIGRYAEGVSADPQRLDEVQERLYQLEELLRQHGPRIDDVLATRQRLERELADLGRAEEELPALEARQGELHRRASRAALELSKKRRKSATQLGRAISAELAELGMGRAKVVLDVSPLTPADDAPAVAAAKGKSARLSREGIDRAQFLIAPNPGLAPQPLARIASGGELSRALLALKRALGHLEHARLPDGERALGIQVFDEVDAGVGGDTADRIGRAIAGISRHRQVLCITHLASIAAHADDHYVVHKSDEAGCTATSIRPVAGRDRVTEIARMLTGKRVTGPAKRAARELIAMAHVVEDAAQ